MTWRLAPSLQALIDETNRRYPQRSKVSDGTIGDQAHSSRTSDHNPDNGVVHAVDLTHDPAHGFDSYAFAEMLRGRRDPRIKYVISNGRMFASYSNSSRPAWVWGTYSGTNAHAHHVHISINHTDAARNNTASWYPAVTTEAGRSTHLKEVEMATIIDRLELGLACDKDGNGWTIIDVPTLEVISVTAHGPYPATDGYWKVPTFAIQARSDKTVLSWTGGPPDGKVGARLKVAKP